MTSPYSCVLFDLDGTITDSAPGITSSLAWMFEQLALPVPSPADLLRYVGPPMLDSFRDFAGFDEQQSRHALSVYRTHYVATGLYDSRVYDGMPAVLEAVASSPLPVSLATSKPESAATLILDHFALAHHFDFLTGASDDEVRSAKKDVVAEALARLSASGADVSNPIMVGDREHDVNGAAAHGVPTLFVSWGYGSPAEAAGSVGVVDTPDELRAAILGG
ncbi:HAD hydrolase-like protein [Marisediminicola sp. LYQ134]|uniref:HAD hydrolase-like protein n=1 Tax=unclassified Marisediminicola TaxID=2618316 RepID=UPI003983044B